MDIDCSELYNPGSAALQGTDLCSYMGFSIALIKDLLDNITDASLKHKLALILIRFFTSYLAGKKETFKPMPDFSPVMTALLDLLEEVNKIDLTRLNILVAMDIENLINYLSHL